MVDRTKDVIVFDELFNDVSGDSQITDQAEEYGDSSSSEGSFNDEVEKVANDLKNSDGGYSLVDIDKISEEAEAEPEEKVEEVAEEIKEDPVEAIVDDCFDSLPEEPKPDPGDAPQASERFEEIVEKATNDLETMPEVREIVEHRGGGVVVVNDEVKWNLDSPASLYNKFYEKKRELVEVYTGEQLDFYALNIELCNASVDISYEVFDKDIVLEQMQEIQQHRERIKNISLKCNIQYFVWKRWIERDMMKGYLAMTEYIKPAIKQEGLVLEHMRDLEYYYAQLEALYNNCHKVEKTLEAAYDTLSRRVSICMELKTGERYIRGADAVQQYSSPAVVQEQNTSTFKEYDGIEDGEVAKKNQSGFVGWSR